MHFLAPSLLLGLVAAVLPYLIHRIGKRRALPVRFAAMQLLLRSERRVHARRRLREILLLVARTAVAASLPFIFARPFTERTSDLPVVAFDAQAAVLILDDSASMQRRAGVGTYFARAKARALALARQLPSDSELAFLLASAASAPRIGELEADRARVVEAIEAVTCSARSADFTSAMRQAGQLLAGSSRTHRRIYLFTDMQATGWEDGPGLPAGAGPEVIVDDATAGAALPNRAIVDARVEPSAEAGPGGDRRQRGGRRLRPTASQALGRDHARGWRPGSPRDRRAARLGPRAQALSARLLRRRRRLARRGRRDRRRCLRPRRSPRGARRNRAQHPRPGRQRRSAHHSQRGRGLLLRDGAAQRLSRGAADHQAGRRCHPGHAGRLHGRGPAQRRGAVAARWPPRSSASSAPAAACSFPWAIAWTWRRGTNVWRVSCRSP